jgi:tartrate dehydratase alpha subunit/fumarate hydratase class I-like protein
LTAVHAERSPTHAAAHVGEGQTRDEEDAIIALSEALAGFRSPYPEVDVRRDLFGGSTHSALLEASAWAQMLMIGAPGVGSARRIHGVWINHALLRHARCPVAVAHVGAVRR